VIEAPARSGAIATARFAAEQGREVFVFPGSHTNTNYTGSHMLIRSGARLVANIEQIIEDLGDHVPLLQENVSAVRADDHPADTAILTVLANAHAPLDVDSIAQSTTLQSHTVQQRLALLTLDGRVIEKSNGFTTV
jgi:DNA processing protein